MLSFLFVQLYYPPCSGRRKGKGGKGEGEGGKGWEGEREGEKRGSKRGSKRGGGGGRKRRGGNC